MGDVVGVEELGSMLTKLYVVGVAAQRAWVALGGLRSWPPCTESDALRVGPSLASLPGPLVFLSSSPSTVGATLLDLAMGKDRPRSLPLLATPTPQVNWVLYPEQSLPCSRQGVQYGRRRSHLDCLSWQAKQSSAAPVAGALLRRLRGEVGAWGGRRGSTLTFSVWVCVADMMGR